MNRRILGSIVSIALLSSSAIAQDTTTIDTQMKEEQLRQLRLANDEQERATAAAKRKALLDAIPSANTTGAVTTKDNAGQAEATALASRTLQPLANIIATRAFSGALGIPASAGDGSSDLCQPLSSSSDTNIPPAPRADGSDPATGTGRAKPDGATNPNIPTGTIKPVANVTGEPAPAARLVLQPGPAILLTSGSDVLTFQHWDQFQFRYCKILTDYAKAISDAKNAINEHKGGGLAGIDLGLSAAVKLAQLITPDWDITNLKADVSNRALLLEVGRAYNEVSHQYATGEADKTCAPKRKATDGAMPVIDTPCPLALSAAVYWQGASGKLGASKVIFDDLKALNDQNLQAEGWLKQVTALLPKAADDSDAETDPAAGDTGKAKPAAKAPAKKAAPAKSKAKAAADAAATKKWTPLKEALDAVIAAHAQLLKDLASTEATATLPLGAVISESAAARLLGNDGLVLNVNVESSGGTGLARKAIWNAFSAGSPFFYVSGTTSVSFALVRPSDQRLISSGSFSCSTGPVRLRKVPATLQLNGQTFRCEAP